MPGHFTFYSNKISSGTAYFDETEFKHVIQVLRYTLGSEIWFTDGCGNRYQGEINFIGKKEFTVAIHSALAIDNQPDIVLGIGILKSSDRLEWATEKCTELGVKELWFLKSKNSERAHINLERLSKVAVSAMKQSHGAHLPTLRHLGVEEAFDYSKMYDNRYIAYCDSEKTNPISACDLPAVIFIGPEGDFTAAEIEWALKDGFKGIGLGRNILRTETAAVAAVSALRLK